LNIVSYMPEITVNETFANAAAAFESTRTPEKPALFRAVRQNLFSQLR